MNVFGRRGFHAVLATIVCAGCAAPGPGEITTQSLKGVSPGMTRDELTRTMGAPTGFSTDRNGVECLAYKLPDSKFGLAVYHYVRQPETMVVLKDGKVAQVEQLMAPGMVNAQCSHVAAKWDPPEANARKNQVCVGPTGSYRC